MAPTTERSYRVGGHIFLTRMSEEQRTLVSSSMQPFEVEGPAQSPVFTFSCVEAGEQMEPAGQIGCFNCGGCMHKVGYSTMGGYCIAFHDGDGMFCGILNTDRHGQDATLCLTSTDVTRRRFALKNALMIAYAFATADMDTVLLHASVVSLNGKAYVFTAPSGTGKSTHTALWRKLFEGCKLVNDDNPVIRMEQGTAIAYGSPWSGKTPCYCNVCHPVGAYVRLFQEQQNKISLLRPLEGYTTLLPAASCMVWDRRMQTGVSATVAAMVERNCVFRLGCLPNKEAALLCREAVTTVY